MIRSIKTRINPFEEGVFVSTNEFGKLTYLVYLDNLVFHYDNEADALEIWNNWRSVSRRIHEVAEDIEKDMEYGKKRRVK